MKFSGNSQAAVSPRLENIAELTVQTDQMDMNQGFGQAAMQLNFVTRRGSNSFHGRVFEDFRSSALNAGSFFSSPAWKRTVGFLTYDEEHHRLAIINIGGLHAPVGRLGDMEVVILSNPVMHNTAALPQTLKARPRMSRSPTYRPWATET